MKPPDKWISLEEAIEMTARAHKCSHRKARRIVLKGIKQQKIRAKRSSRPDPSVYSITGKDAVEAYEDRSDLVFTTLGQMFHDTFHFEEAEIIGELQSGRLVARARPETIAWVEAGQPVNPDEFEITMKALHDWMSNPDTPVYLIEKAARAMQQKDN